MSVDNAAMMLGKKPAVFDPDALKLAMFMTTPFSFPTNFDKTSCGKNWGAMLNKALGCCTISGIGHLLQAVTKLVREEWTASDAQILGKYEAWDGYVDGVPSTDEGGVEADVLTKWFREPDGFYGHRVVAYGYVHHANDDEIRHFIADLNGLYIGVELPLTAQSQEVWGVTDASLAGDAAPGSWGGHCVYVYGYTSDENGNLATVKFISWGVEMVMTAAFWHAYVDEAWGVLVGADVKGGKTAGGLDVAAAAAEVNRLKSAA